MIQQSSDLFDLTGRVAVVTGGGRGIGAAIAGLLAHYGADVVLAGRDTAALERTSAIIAADTGRACLVERADISIESDVARLIGAAAAWRGRLDILVNNAGGPGRALLEDMTSAQWDEVLGANLRGAFLCTREAGKKMIAAGRGGAIVNVSSLAGLNAVPFAAAYGAAKAGLENFTQATARAWARYNIRANAITVGTVAHADKPRPPEVVARSVQDIPLGRLGTPEDIAAVALFLASDAAAFVTGASILATGGQVDPALSAR
jgi:citronellol/citronellal dehydrogenase